MDKNKKNFDSTDHTAGYRIFEIVHKIVDENPDADYFFLNDAVHDTIKEEFNYTHELRKEYQTAIRFVMDKKGSL